MTPAKEKMIDWLQAGKIVSWNRWRRMTKYKPIDLTRANLTRANLTRANLTRADLTRADLTEANLTGANLTRANLTRANLTRADLTRADLTRANLAEANLTGANLTGANLTGANLDFTAWPLWCGSIGVKIDSRISRQLVYHAIVNMPEEDRNAFLANPIKYANKFHKIEDARVDKIPWRKK